MVIKQRKIEVHWNYLISIERDLEHIARYIEFDKDNFQCFSIELSRVLMAAAAEVDVVCKQICKKINLNSRASSINKYREEILQVYNNIPQFKVTMPRYGLELTPWQNWKNKKDNVPFWWTAYNKIKHHRHTHYQGGNLNNCLNSVAGLFVMTLYLYREKANLGELLPALKILQVAQEHFRGFSGGGFEFGIVYNV